MKTKKQRIKSAFNSYSKSYIGNVKVLAFAAVVVTLVTLKQGVDWFFIILMFASSLVPMFLTLYVTWLNYIESGKPPLEPREVTFAELIKAKKTELAERESLFDMF